jgi:hypothetical protein
LNTVDKKILRLFYASVANFTLVELLVHTISTGDFNLHLCFTVI